MSKRAFKTAASSGKASGFGGFGSIGDQQSSTLSFVQPPLDLSAIEDPELVVVLKNLSKKDSTTKAKALDDLSTWTDTQDEINDGLLEAWVRLFPRLSIENERRLRASAHIVNGKVCSSAGKRVAKYMPRIAGAWFAGFYDVDKSVAKAASEALAHVVNDTEKRRNARKVYTQQIVDYCTSIVLHETVNTLSDERAVSKDDAENTYARVVSSTLSLFTSLIAENDKDTTQDNRLESIIEKKFFDFATFSDASVRRSTHAFTRAVLQRYPEIIESHLSELSNVYVYKGLKSDQTGSSLQYVQVLLDLTFQFPTIWTEAYSNTKSVIPRLEHFVKQGSQTGSSEFWPALARLFDALVGTGISIEKAPSMLNALRQGLGQRSDRFHAHEAWSAYVHVVETLYKLQTSDQQKTYIDENVTPFLQQYFWPVEGSEWAIPTRSVEVVVMLMRVGVFNGLLSAWLPDPLEHLMTKINTAAPQDKEENAVSQAQIAAAGERWSSFQPKLLANGDSSSLYTSYDLTSHNTKLLQTALRAVKDANGTPYGTAAIVDSLLRDCSADLMRDSVASSAIAEFARESLPSLAFSPSARHLVRCVGACASRDDLEDILLANLKPLSSSDEPSEQRLAYIVMLFSQKMPAKAFKIAQNNGDLQGFIIKACTSVPLRNPGSLSRLTGLGVLSRTTQLDCIEHFNQSLNDPDQTKDALKELDLLAFSHGDMLKTYDSERQTDGQHLLANALRLAEDPDEDIANLAMELSSKLSVSDGGPQNQRLHIIQQALEKADDTSPSVDSLLDLAGRLLGRRFTASNLISCLPDAESWQRGLSQYMGCPDSSLSICRSLGGALSLLKISETLTVATYDPNWLSGPLRTALFFSKIVSRLPQEAVKHGASAVLLDQVLLSLITVLIAEDKLSYTSSNVLWDDHEESEAMVIDFVHETKTSLTPLFGRVSLEQFNRWRQESPLFRSGPTSSVWAYYLAYAEARILETQDHLQDDMRLEVRIDDEEIFGTLKNIVILQHRQIAIRSLLRPCNEIVAYLTGADFNDESELCLRQLITLNVMLSTSAGLLQDIAKQRIVFLIKHLLDQNEQTTQRAVSEEISKLLLHLIPAIQDLYGEHWTGIVRLMLGIWDAYPTTRSTALLYCSLKLLALLRRLSDGKDANEDLFDALKEHDHRIGQILLDLLLIASTEASDIGKQPMRMKNEMLYRMVKAHHTKLSIEESDLFQALHAPSTAIQEAVFTLLHEKIPSQQEQISIDAALDDKTAAIPADFLELLQEPPVADSSDIVDVSLVGYVRIWRLLFDFFERSSSKVKTDYIDQLRDGKYLPRLMSLVLDGLGITRNKPVDVSGFDLVRYQAGFETDPSRDQSWLLAHLYYLALTHTPSLVKAHVLEIRSRQIPATLETWTAKYVSPVLISNALESVTSWSEKTVNEDPEYEKMSVKIATKSKEINVSYLVDEQTMAIKVILPDAYPLTPAQVVGISRVAVKEEKWQSWLRNCQGVITFSIQNGSVTDGLAAWRRNVTGALKGQTECAICYSIISADKQLPTKRCPTCKNLFHSSCLFKWFKTSNASTCPLCRNAFNFN